MQIFGQHGNEEMEVNLRDMLSQLPGFKGRTKRRRVKVPEAKKILEAQEAAKSSQLERQRTWSSKR